VVWSPTPTRGSVKDQENASSGRQARRLFPGTDAGTRRRAPRHSNVIVEVPGTQPETGLGGRVVISESV
jgi:hypothetical protein